MSASLILDEYLKKTASAVLDVADSFEKIKGEIQSPEEAAALSVALYGAPPKPSASAVASIITGERTSLNDKYLSDNVLLKMSVARVGQENNRKRADQAADEIRTIMEDITGSLSGAYRQYSPLEEENKVHIGITNNKTPSIVCGYYTMDTSISSEPLSLTDFQNPTVIANVTKRMESIFSKVDSARSTRFDAFVNGVANNMDIKSSIDWANMVENVIKLPDSTPNPCSVDTIVSRDASVVKTAVNDIYASVGKSYCRPATQLTFMSEIEKLRKAAVVCFEALMSDTRERAFVEFLFYVSFKEDASNTNSKLFVQNKLSSMSGNPRQPIKLVRRSAEETLFGLCFMFKVMPPEFMNCIFNFPTIPHSTQYHGLYGTCLTPLLRKYGSSFEKSWAHFEEILSERANAVKKFGVNDTRIDCLDAVANLTGPVYVLILDLVRTLSAQRSCSTKFLREIKENYLLWNRFVS
ncbi:VP51 [Procambarus clarkii virus]|nr:VP51 [Procambarus clarkii virus]